MLTVCPHPLLDLHAFETEFASALGALPEAVEMPALLAAAAHPSLAADDAVRSAVRTMLRQDGYKPTGRGKPASEYLIKAAAAGLPAINLAVDVCNAISLHSGLPISVVDLDRVEPPFTVRVVEAGGSYVFNAAGQSMDLGGLLCLCDAEGPCANAVKDSQRTKTSAATRRTLSLVWGTTALAGRAAATEAKYREMLESFDARTRGVHPQ